MTASERAEDTIAVPDALDAAMALVAGSLLEEQSLVMPTEDQRKAAQRFEQRYLTLSAGHSLFGRAIADTLLPLRQQLAEARSGKDEAGEPTMATHADRLVEESLVELMGGILNPALRFTPTNFQTDGDPSLVEAYRQTLFSADPATSAEVEPDERVRAATELLWSGDGGEPSAMYRRYMELRESLQAAEAALLEAADASEKAAVQKRIAMLRDRLEVEGRRQDVETALKLVREHAGDQLFYANRINDWRARFRGSSRDRLFAGGQAFQHTRIVPLAPLVTGKPATSWRKMAIESDSHRRLLEKVPETVTGFSVAALLEAARDIRALHFEYIVCSIERDWLAGDFLSARFWRTRQDIAALSDGSGGGAVPLLPAQVVFLRDIQVKTESLRASTSQGSKGPARLSLLTQSLAATPVKRLTLMRKSGAFPQAGKAMAAARKIKRQRTGNRSRRPRVRDHRGRADRRTTVRATRGNRPRRVIRATPTRKPRPANGSQRPARRIVAKPVTHLVIQVKAAGGVARELAGLRAVAEPIDGNESTPITLTKDRPAEGSVRFRHSFRRDGTESATAFDVTILDEHDQPVVDTILVTIDQRPRKQKLNLTLSRSIVSELEHEPDALMLYGYICRLLPRSPNPDDSLQWDD